MSFKFNSNIFIYTYLYTYDITALTIIIDEQISTPTTQSEPAKHPLLLGKRK